jgi:lipid-binding SYLF domain-containing protein
MKQNRGQTVRTLICGATLGLIALVSLSTPSRAETGTVRVVFTKAGFIVGVGGGRGVLTFRGRHYPFKVSGMSFGATIGASRNEMVGRAFNLSSPRDLAGNYSSMGAGVAVAGGPGGAQLQNANGVILQLKGVKVGAEFSAAVGGVTIVMR